VLASCAALFAAAGAFVSRVDVLAHYEVLLPLLRGGVTLHWAAALLIFVWGVFLLGRSACGGGESRAWAALVVPCPVCMSVILMSASCVALYFPEHALRAMAGLYAAFASLATVSALAAGAGGGSGRAGSAKNSLGTAMILIAAYFMISAVVTPQFAEIGRVYRLAVYAAEGVTPDRPAQLWALGGMAALFAAGFASAWLRTGRRRKRGKFGRDGAGVRGFGSEAR
jgi:predicted transporter